MSTDRETSSGTEIRRSTSAPSASCGITSARTKLVTSSRWSPEAASSSMSRTFSSVGTTSGSFWNPSRGPTSRIVTCTVQILGILELPAGYANRSSTETVIRRGGPGAAANGPPRGSSGRWVTSHTACTAAVRNRDAFP